MSPAEPQPPQRNIDEHIDALAMNMKLHAAIMRGVDAKPAKLDEKTNERIEKLGYRIDKLAVTVTELSGAVQILAAVAQSHERRLESLENGRVA